MKTKRKALCRTCGDVETVGNCVICRTPICDGCAQKRSNRVCSECSTEASRRGIVGGGPKR
jgi:hypothetical protein